MEISDVKFTEYEIIRDCIRKLNQEFLPKCTWEKCISDMVYEGLVDNKWKAVAMFDGKTVVSYIDYKKTKDGFVEIGVMFTETKHRCKGYASKMIQTLIDRFRGHVIISGTYESNLSMRKCFIKNNFKEYRRKQDRVDGSFSIYYRLQG